MTMRRLAIALGLFSTLAGSCVVWADEPMPSTSPALETRLATYDPRAVAAARHYFEAPAIKAGMVAMVDSLNKAVGESVARQNPQMTPQQLEKLRLIAGDALKERLDLILRMNMIVALDTFSTDELVAMDRFYSSPEGVAILAKMPKVAAQMPAIMRTIMPDYLSDVRSKLKANGAEFKL